MATKKVKKVEVPIDERETFVSLQKNFAEGEDRVEEKLKLLYQLQKADSEIDKIIQLRGELPAEVEELEADIAALRTQSADISAFIIALNQSISDNKQNILDCDDQIAKYQGQLQGVTNSREFDSINKEIENQNLLRQIVREESGGQNRSYTFVAQLDGRTLFSKVVTEAELRQMQTGRNPFEL